ncbi:M50 family metallopeptidase [uncultured Pseudomonas sp.]|uniref:M50 family metallopeptidase n=1 Tax=uncultured Pseudomonas sp. TaxID=114707 RepID=UPI0025E03F37|nr:M50 family metallopeptidase [uncultured Pseudomonas sp.]
MGNTAKRGLNRLMVLIQVALFIGACAWAGVLMGMGGIFRHGPFVSVLLVTVLIMLATLIHEAGHWLGARLAGMPVLQVQVFHLAIQPQRRGLRVRLKGVPRSLGLSGYVFAAQRPDQPVRESLLLFVVMGPLANLIAAALCLILAVLGGSLIGVLPGFALINLGMGLANLVPTWGRSQSDGFKLLTWWRRPDQNAADLAYTRLLAHYVAGVPAERLAVEDIQALAEQPMPMPLIALSYQIYARQALEDWPGIQQLDSALQAMLDAHSKQLLPVATSIAIMQRDLAYSRAYYTQDASALDAYGRNRDVDWFAPSLAPRCDALRAALQGDVPSMERHLAKALQLARNHVAGGYAALEEQLATQIRERARTHPAEAQPAVA